ncbi:MAG: peptide ABC transporter substrate-binding protein [Litorilinea sp.]|nr:MAG: peptide ABC transporter substrate-binding protein [Litorilinea sp.]
MFKKQYWLLAVLLILSLLIGACSGPAPAAEAPAGSGAAGQAAAPAPAAAGSSQLPVDVPRQDLFVMDQIFRYSVIDNYNFWINGPHEPHRHALMMETLWIRDQETGERINDVAASGPVYNDDFTQMDVQLRDNIYWSDGVQFTADDLIYTVELLKSNPSLNKAGWSTQLNQFMESVEKTGDFSVRFHLTGPNPRFHNLFEARWNGIYMMPKHIFEEVEDPATFNFSPPVVLGAYVPVESDPNGYWELFKLREDWERTPAGIVVGEPGPPYVLTIFYGDSAKKAIAMSRGELDVYFDADIEAFETTLDTTPTARSWYTDFPWAYPNEVSTRQLTFNLDNPLYANKDVRWALALALNIVELQTEYIGGVAKVTPVHIPPTSTLTRIYLDPLEEWLQNLEIEIEPGVMYKPYDPTVPDQIAAWAESQGYQVPGTPREVFGTGWWKHDPEVAERLLLKHGFSRDGNGKWLTPDGEPWVINLISPPDENDAFRMANAAADMWSDFGIDVNLQGLERSVWDQNNFVGQFDVTTPWHSMALASGDIWPESRGLHPQYYVPAPEDHRSLGGSNVGRVNDPRIGELLDAMQAVNPDSEENFELGREFLKHWIENMYDITAISFKKFVTWDERYWTGFPTAENPTYMPLYWFQGGKFPIQDLDPVGQ